MTALTGLRISVSPGESSGRDSFGRKTQEIQHGYENQK